MLSDREDDGRPAPEPGAVISPTLGSNKRRTCCVEMPKITYLRRRASLGAERRRLLGHLPEQELGPRAAEAVALLALIAGQDVEPVEGSDGTDGRWRIAQRVAPDRVISTVDPDTRHVHKSGAAPPGRVQGASG